MVIDNSEAISELDAVLQAGATNVAVDGQQITTDLATIERERRRLIEQQTATRHQRPRVATIDLSQG